MRNQRTGGETDPRRRRSFRLLTFRDLKDAELRVATETSDGVTLLQVRGGGGGCATFTSGSFWVCSKYKG